MNSAIRFREVQSWAVLWFRPLAAGTLILAALAAAMWHGYDPNSNESVQSFLAIGMLVVFSVLILGVPLLWCSIMVTRVSDDGIHIRYWPIHLFWHRRVSPDDVVDCEHITESFVTGYGIHTDGVSWVYNVRGHEFIRLRLKNRKEVIIGTQRPEELVHAIAALREETLHGSAISIQ